jgi:hypothetical protein
VEGKAMILIIGANLAEGAAGERVRQEARGSLGRLGQKP